MLRPLAFPRLAATMRNQIRRRGILSLLGLLLLLYFGLCASIAWDAVRPKAPRLYGSPADFGAAYQDVMFTSRDGTRLSGWFVPAPRPRGVIILCHGISSNRCGMLYAVPMLRQVGYDTLLFDFRACGRSGGARFTLGLREPDDVQAAVRWLQSQPETHRLPIGVLGDSAGAASAIIAAARTPAIRAVIAESPFAELRHAVDNRFRLIAGSCGPVVLAPARWMGGWLIGGSPDHVAPAAVIGRIAPRPILLIQDGADQIAPPSETAELLAKAGPNTSVWFVPGAGHVGAFGTQQAEYTRRVQTFFERALATP